MKKLGCMAWLAVGTCLSLTSCREEIDEGPTEAEILAELKAEKLREGKEKERKRKESVERLMERMRREQSEAASQEQAQASSPAFSEDEVGKVVTASSGGSEPEAPAPVAAKESAAELAHLRALEQEDRREQLKKIRGNIINLKMKREAVEDRISDVTDKLKEAEEAAEIARYGDPASRIRLAGSDTRKTAAADAEVKKIKAQISKLKKEYEGYRDAIAEQKMAYNSL